jgi:hypothetical protein
MRIKNWKLFNESVDHIIEGESILYAQFFKF